MTTFEIFSEFQFSQTNNALNFTCLSREREILLRAPGHHEIKWNANKMVLTMTSTLYIMKSGT